MEAGSLEEFKIYVDLMKSYLTLTLQTFALAMTVTSGVVAYLVKNEDSGRRRGIAVLLPAVLCAGLGIGFLMQTSAAAALRDRLVELATQLDFGLAPHGKILVSALWGLGGLVIAISIVLILGQSGFGP